MACVRCVCGNIQVVELSCVQCESIEWGREIKFGDFVYCDKERPSEMNCVHLGQD